MNKAAETAKIPCAVCRDLMPLVQDGVASPESEALVQAHMAVCPACRALWQGTDDPAMPELPKADVLAALIVFRMFYLLLPFALSLLVVLGFEWSQWRQRLQGLQGHS